MISSCFRACATFLSQRSIPHSVLWSTSYFLFWLPVVFTSRFTWLPAASKISFTETPHEFRNFALLKKKRFTQGTSEQLRQSLYSWWPFFSCWIPFSFISVVSNLCGSQCVRKIPHEVVVLFLMFGYLNSALNPFLLAFRNSRFKATMSALMQSLRSRPVAKGSRRRSTLTQSTGHSELPDLQESQIRLHFANAKRDSFSRNIQSTLWISSYIEPNLTNALELTINRICRGLFLWRSGNSCESRNETPPSVSR